MLDSGAERPGFKSQPWRCRVTVLGKLFTPVMPHFHKAAKLVAALLRVAGVTAGLAESNGSLPPGLWLTSPARWLPRTGISSRILRSVVEYGQATAPDYRSSLNLHDSYGKHNSVTEIHSNTAKSSNERANIIQSKLYKTDKSHSRTFYKTFKVLNLPPLNIFKYFKGLARTQGTIR